VGLANRYQVQQTGCNLSFFAQRKHVDCRELEAACVSSLPAIFFFVFFSSCFFSSCFFSSSSFFPHGTVPSHAIQHAAGYCLTLSAAHNVLTACVRRKNKGSVTSASEAGCLSTHGCILCSEQMCIVYHVLIIIILIKTLSSS